MTILTVMSGCGGSNAISTTSTATKGISFSLSKTSLVSAKTSKTVNASVPASLDPTATSAVLTVVDNTTGNIVLADFKTEIYSLGGSYVTATIPLRTGSYSLTKFLVMDSNNHVLYLSPTQSADDDIKALVSQPLPLSFAVTAEGANVISLQVLAPDDSTPESFGYPSVSFSILNYIKFRSVVQTLDETAGTWLVVAANLSVNGVNYSHPAQTSTLRVLESDSYTLIFSKDGYATKTITLGANEIANYQATPLVVTLNPSHTVSFDSNGGTAVPPQAVVDGGQASRPADPSRAGFAFAHWYLTDPAVAFPFTTVVTGSMTLHAKWNPIEERIWDVAGTYTFQIPAGVTAITITVVGAEGGKGGDVYDDATGAGGAGGGFSRVMYGTTRLVETKGGDGEHGAIGDDSAERGEGHPGLGENYSSLGPNRIYYGPFSEPLTLMVGKTGENGWDGCAIPGNQPPNKDGKISITWQQ
jgi:uncharacterized repeat protein (TIGR02543 family)